MFNIKDPNLSYILVSPEKPEFGQIDNNLNCERCCSILYSKDYTVFPIATYERGNPSRSFIAIPSSSSNDELRRDSLFLMDKFNIESVVVKYHSEDSPTKISINGSEKELGIGLYESSENTKIFVHGGISFNFFEKKKYRFPKDKRELKRGMVVEFFNNNRWVTKQVHNPDDEWERMYKLLTKYNKLRVEC